MAHARRAITFDTPEVLTLLRSLHCKKTREDYSTLEGRQLSRATDVCWSTLRVSVTCSSLPSTQVATMVTKECFGCEKVTSHEHLHDCAPGIPETHMVGSERFVCVLCEHVTFAGSDGASRFPFTFDKVAAGR